MFYVGQFVLCVDDRNSEVLGIYPPAGVKWRHGLHGLRRGAVYTVRSLSSLWDEPALHIEEIVRPIDRITGTEPGFWSRRFMPLKDSSLEVFRKALEPAPNETEPA